MRTRYGNPKMTGAKMRETEKTGMRYKRRLLRVQSKLSLSIARAPTRSVIVPSCGVVPVMRQERCEYQMLRPAREGDGGRCAQRAAAPDR